MDVPPRGEASIDAPGAMTPMQTDTRPTPEPLHVKKERQAAEGQAAWTQYRAEQDAVNKNMERLRAERLKRDAALVTPAPGPKKRKTKSVRAGEGSKAQNQADRP